MPLARLLAQQIALLDLKALANTLSTVAQVRRRVEAFVAGETAAKGTRRTGGIGAG